VAIPQTSAMHLYLVTSIQAFRIFRQSTHCFSGANPKQTVCSAVENGQEFEQHTTTVDLHMYAFFAVEIYSAGWDWRPRFA